MNYLPGILVNAKFGSVTDIYVGQLGFTIVRLHPLRDINERDHLRARRNKLSCPDLAFAHSTLARRVNLRVAKIHHSCREVRLFRMQIGLKLRILRFEDCFRTPLGFRSEFAAEQDTQLQADLHAKQANLAAAMVNLGYTKIYAPGEGTVGERQVRTGQLVSPGAQVIAVR